jgi:PEP-CTERM motif
MNVKLFGALALTAGCTLMITAPAFATPINVTGGGVLNISNLSVNVTGTSASGCINFYNTPTPDACNLAGSSTFQVNGPFDPTLFFNLETGNIKDIPAPTSFPITAFITLPGGGSPVTPAITMDLLSLIPPSAPPCPPAATPGSCDLPASPFLITVNSANSITVSFDANLCAYITGSSSGTNCSTGTPYGATFTAQFRGTLPGGQPVTLANLISLEQSTGGISSSVSATLAPSSAVPEPGTMLLFGMGFLGMGFGMRRLRRS